MLRPITPCPLCGRNTRFWPPGSNHKWECNAIDLSWPGVIDAGRDMTNDGTVQLLLSPERQPTFAIHKHCLWVLCRDGSVSYMDAYRLCRSLQQEKDDEPGFDSIIDPLHLFDSPDPFDSRNYESILGQKKQTLAPASCDALEEPQPPPLERLPLELLHGVFEHLPLYSLMACSYVSTYIEAAVQGFCTSDPLMKHAITRFAGLSTIPDGWDLIRRQFSSGRNQTMNMIDNFWQLLDNTRSLRRIQVTERTPFDAKLRPLDIDLPVTFYTQRVRRRRYVCGVRLHDGRVFGVETKAVHRTNAALDEDTPLRLFFDGLGVHGIGVGTYFWKDPAARRSEVFCWGLDSGASVPCVFDGCKIRLHSASPDDSPSETPEPSGPMAILVH